MIQIEQLYYLVEVYEERSITRAATNLKVSPSAISQSLTHLENKYNIQLFDRSRKGTIPTRDGFNLVVKAKNILRELYEFERELIEKRDGHSKNLRIACAPSLTFTVYEVLGKFKAHFPELQVEIIEIEQSKILDGIKQGEIDIGFAPFEKNELDDTKTLYKIEYRQIHTAFVCVCVNKNSFLKQKHVILPEDLKNEKIVIYNSSSVKAYKSKHLKDIPILFLTNNIEVIKKAVIDGEAFTLAYDFTFKTNPDFLEGKIVNVPFISKDDIQHSFWSVYSEKKGLTPQAIDFERQLIKALNA